MATLIDCKPKEVNIAFWHGDSFALTITCTANGTPINLTGYTAKMAINNRHTGEQALLLQTGGSGITVNGSGVISITITAAQSNALSGQSFVYDLQVTDTGGLIRTYMYGILSVDSDKTPN